MAVQEFSGDGRGLRVSAWTVKQGMQAIRERIDRYPDFLAPLRIAAGGYIKYPSKLSNDGVISIAHRPWVGMLNYMLTLYPGLSRDDLDRYCQTFQIETPGIYGDFLCEVNGAFCFGMSLCGVPPSMLGNPPLLDRTILQCHDLATAATRWVVEYRVPKGFFHFGGRHFSYLENVGYFIDQGKRILCVQNKGNVIGEWSSFADFLTDELDASEMLEEELHPSQWSASNLV